MVKKTGSRLVGVRLVVHLTISLTIFGAVSLCKAQNSTVTSKVFNISAQPSGNGTVVSIAADNALSRAQTWQDSEGYHLVFPNTAPADSLKGARGVRVRRAGTSLEVLVQTKPGSKVTIQPEGNHFDLVIDGRLEASSPDDQESQSQLSSETARSTGKWSSDLPPEPFPKFALPTPKSSASQIEVEPEDEGLLASIFSGTGVLLMTALGLFGLVVSRRLRSREVIVHMADGSLSDNFEWDDYEPAGSALELRDAKKSDPGSALKPAAMPNGNGSSAQKAAGLPVAGPTSLYGAYRIDQEVCKLILGQPHRADVLASRAIEDRRAIETSLIKGINAFDVDEGARRRARTALEEYGFVARQCAALLLSADPFDRTSAARCLGEIKSEAALPFLLESLYDTESIVRNQAVVSIGELKLPSAIGALLDIARTHPDVPSALLSRTLSACSVEGLDFFDAAIPGASQLALGHDLSVVEQITHLEPASSVEELPESSDDEQLAQALVASESGDLQERSEALKTLAQFRVQSSVRAIERIAREDSEPNIRSIAIASLSSIDHESVFPAILIAMADDTREVRASAARALNRLSFDRADAYVRVIETSDENALWEVAHACIKAGIVSQNVDRLGTSDYRQAYETFSIICLLAKANLTEPILNAIANHSNVDVSLRTIHLLASTGQPGTIERLQELAEREGVCEEVKTALLETIYNLEHAKRKEEEAAVSTTVDSEPKVESSDEEAVGGQSGSGLPIAFMPASETEREVDSGGEDEFRVDKLEL